MDLPLKLLFERRTLNNEAGGSGGSCWWMREELARLVFRQNTLHQLWPLYCQGNLAGVAKQLKTKTDWEMFGWKKKTRKRASKA